MGSMNRATIIGNVGKEPEVRTTQGGTRCANLSIATSERWKDKATGEAKERTEWHKIVIWGDALVDLVERYVHKGSQLLVEGKIATRKWEKDGVDHYSTEIVLQGFDAKLLLLDKAEASAPAGKPAQAAQPAHPPQLIDDEIPF